MRWEAYSSQRPLFTILLYLNGDFGGEQTTPHPPSADLASMVSEQGAIFCFPETFILGGTLEEEATSNALADGGKGGRGKCVMRSDVPFFTDEVGVATKRGTQVGT